MADAGMTDAVQAVSPLGGGCMHNVVAVNLSRGGHLVAKCAHAADADMLNTESHSLEAIAATGTVRVPDVHTVGVYLGTAILLMEHLPGATATARAWPLLGTSLASLHDCAAGQAYGYCSDNYLGRTPQRNTWCKDWVEFNVTCRLEPQLALAIDSDLLQSGEKDVFESLIKHLGDILPHQPPPALLHGDLWSGNAVACGKELAIIDPACSIGDRWCDIAMMRLFGGFPEEAFEAYEAATGQRADSKRIAVYQTYHLLNHVNLFGRSYLAAAMGAARSALSC
jgi:fructosamine-3-kinase